MARFAVRTIWCAYIVLGILLVAFFFVLESKRLDIGGVTLALILMGVGSVVVAVALLVGSAMGTRALVADMASRRGGIVFTVLAGWIGFVVLAWLAWGFWLG